MTDAYAAAIISLQSHVSLLREWQTGVTSAIDALTDATVKVREDLMKTNRAALMESRAMDRMNDLLGLQAVQIRDLVRQNGVLEGRLNGHLDAMGYSE